VNAVQSFSAGEASSRHCLIRVLDQAACCLPIGHQSAHQSLPRVRPQGDADLPEEPAPLVASEPTTDRQQDRVQRPGVARSS
jgi:hypothetical protein